MKASGLKRGNLTVQAVLLTPVYVTAFLMLAKGLSTFATKEILNSEASSMLRTVISCDSYSAANDAMCSFQEAEGGYIKLCGREVTVADLAANNDSDFRYLESQAKAYIWAPDENTGEMKAEASCTISRTPDGAETAEMESLWKIGNMLELTFYNKNIASRMNFSIEHDISSLTFWDTTVVSYDPLPRVTMKLTIENEA
jgi:hypothetical protein